MLANNLDKRLMEVGYDALTPFEKNNLTARIAEIKGILYNEVSEQVLLDYHKEIKIQLFSDICEEKIVKGFIAFNGHTYRTNRDDQTNMLGQKDELVDDPSISVVLWKAEDEGRWIEHDREEWLQVYKEAFTHKRSISRKYDLLKIDINAANSHPEIVNVVWD